VQVNDPFPCGANRVVNRVDIGGAESECDLSDNWSADHTPISGCTPIQVFLPLVLKQEQGVPPVQVAFSSANYQVWENSVVATITVVLNSPSSQVVTVDYATSDGTATAGRDYVAASGTLTFVPGQTSQIFTVRILTDTLSESPETVILTLSRPVNAELGQPNPATLTIVDLCSPTPPNCAPAVWCTFPSNFGPMGMAYDTFNSRLFVANQGDASNSGNLTIFTSAGVPIQALGGLSNAQGVALDNTRGRNRAYVAGGNWLYIVDASGVVPSVLATVDVGIGGDVGAHSVAYDPNTDLIYVTGYNDDSVTVVSGATWDVLRRMTGFHEPSYTVVNTVTNKVYVSNHTGGVPWGYVSVISGTSKIAPDVHLGGDLYGIAVDSVRNRIYVGSISAARVYVIDGRTDTTMGDIQIVRARDARPVPLRMTVVNPSVISDTHLWITSSQGDYWGMDRLILLDLPGSEWPPQTPRVLRATAVEASPEGGLLVDTVSWNVFASSAVSNLVTASHDSTTLCATPLSLNAEQEQLYTVVSNYRQRGSDR
jgi:DNA-binding beta-propeller fold protein YncE